MIVSKQTKKYTMWRSSSVKIRKTLLMSCLNLLYVFKNLVTLVRNFECTPMIFKILVSAVLIALQWKKTLFKYYFIEYIYH